jgi:hypothetical protein
MKPAFLCGESLQQLETLAAQWGWTRINKGWGWRAPGGAEVCHARGREQLRGYRDAVLLVAPFESVSAYHAGRIEEIIAAARGQGFEIRQAGQDADDPLERAS